MFFKPYRIKRHPSSRNPDSSQTYFRTLAAALVLAFFATGCEEPGAPAPSKTAPSAKSQVSTTAPTGQPVLSANPNPVVGDSKDTTITWDVADVIPGEVYVSSSGGTEHLFARGVKGSKQIDWIGATPHEFRLYAGNDHKNQLATITVTHAAAAATSKKTN